MTTTTRSIWNCGTFQASSKAGNRKSPAAGAAEIAEEIGAGPILVNCALAAVAGQIAVKTGSFGIAKRNRLRECPPAERMVRRSRRRVPTTPMRPVDTFSAQAAD